MYKKQFAVQGQNLLSKKDLKTLKTQISESIPGLEDKILDELLPDGQVKVLKLDNRCLLYVVGEGPPLFFDLEGRGELYPTLDTLWRYPYVMPELTIHGPVSKFVLNGADLMLQGLIEPANGVAGYGKVTKGQKRCIKIEGNPYPIAVGKMLVNQSQMDKLKGKGLEVSHVFRDTLWTFAGKVFPNEGFSEKEDEITPCATLGYSPGGGATTAAPPAAAADEAPASPTAGGEASPKARTSSSVAASPKVGPSPNPADGGGAGSSRAAADWSQDELLEFCFMQAFKLSLVDDKALPVEASELYEKHMKPQRPEGTTLDVKKSSHKQIGKFLNVMRKAKVIDVTEKKGVISVVKADRGHKLWAQQEEKFAAEAETATASTNAGKAEAVELPPPVVRTLWKPTHYTEGFFKSMGRGKAELFSWDEARGVLVAYIEQEKLGDVSGGAVKINEELINVLLKASGALKKGATFPEEMDLSDLEDKLQERMSEHTCIEVTGVGATTRKGPAQKVEVSLSRKGAHNVTRICNLEAYGLDVEAMADELKKKLNCTAHIEDMPGKNSKDKMMQLQGHADQELAKYLQERYGITKSFMSVK